MWWVAPTLRVARVVGSGDAHGGEGVFIQPRPRHGQFIAFLQVHPEFRRRAEGGREPERRVARHPAFARDDHGHPVARHADARGERVGGEAEGGHEFLGQHLAGVDGGEAVSGNR